MDLLLSRPIPRWVYLISGVIVSVLGLVISGRGSDGRRIDRRSL